MRSRESKKRIRSLVLLIAFTTVLLIISVYAWFSTQKNVAINNLKGRIEVAEGLQLSIDAENWAQSIEFGTTNTGLGEKISNGIVADWNQFDLGIQSNSSYYQHNGVNYVTNNIRPVMNVTDFNRGSSATDSTTGYLTPVSTAGALTSDLKHIKFFAGTYAGVKLSQIYKEQETVETGIYAFDIYLMNNTKGDKADQLYLNYDSIVREIKLSLESEDYGLKNCVRVGLAFYSGVTDSSSSKEQVLEATYNSQISQVAIWEPNYDEHSAHVMKQNEKLRTLAENSVTDASAINSLFIDDYPVDTQIVDVYTTDSNLIGLNTYNAIRTKGEIVTAEIDEEQVSANASGIQRIKDVDGNDVKLIANKISKMRVYVWIDGQDPDCINWASHSDGIDVNIGLVKAGAGKQFEGDNLNQVTEDIDQETYAWVQYRDEVNKIPYVTNGNVTLEVGTAVTGYSAGEKGDGEWYILGAENGMLLLSTRACLGGASLSGQSGYVNCIDNLNSSVEAYNDLSKCYKVRAIKLEDINRVTGYNPELTGNGAKCSNGKLWEYGHQVIYTKNKSTGIIWYKGLKNLSSDTESSDGYSELTYYTGNEWKTLSNGEKVILSSNYCAYYPKTLDTSNTGGLKGISETSLAYQELFGNLSGGKYTYWLASQFISPGKANILYGTMYIQDGRIHSGTLYESRGNTLGGGGSTKPVVYITSSVKVDDEAKLSL